jgi:serine/threonine protein kinase
MGEVYRARDTRLDRIVAIKVLPTDLSRSPEARQRLEREARAISALSHPHICTLYDIGHQDGVDYLVMEYLEGETLEERLRKGPLPLNQVLRYGVEIADALSKAHAKGIVHRDLKPGNIMLTRSGAKLLDFGLARVMKQPAPVVGLAGLTTETMRLTGEGVIVGTWQYMAPEQLEGGEADARTDIFALGTVLYEMATGRAAFSGKTQASLIAAILSSHPPAIASLQSMSPPALDHAVRKCLEKDPQERWPTSVTIANQRSVLRAVSQRT